MQKAPEYKHSEVVANADSLLNEFRQAEVCIQFLDIVDIDTAAHTQTWNLE